MNEAAIVLGLGVTSIYNLIARDQLAAIKIGHRSLIEVESIDKFIASRPAAKVVVPRRSRRKRRLGQA